MRVISQPLTGKHFYEVVGNGVWTLPLPPILWGGCRREALAVFTEARHWVSTGMLISGQCGRGQVHAQWLWFPGEATLLPLAWWLPVLEPSPRLSAGDRGAGAHSMPGPLHSGRLCPEHSLFLTNKASYSGTPWVPGKPGQLVTLLVGFSASPSWCIWKYFVKVN